MAQTSGLGETNLKEINAITTRSGKVIEPTSKLRESEKDPSSIEESTPSEEAVKNSSTVPFSQALKSTSKSASQHNEILEHLRQVKINLPLLHVISQVPTYAKVLKDLCTIRRKYHVKKTSFLTERVSAVIEQRVPPKYKDLGCPTASYIIGNHEIAQALLDLGASVNIMPYAIYSTLGLDVDVNSKIPIILGRHFLATTNALINCRNGLMKLSFGNMTLDVNIFHIMKQPEEDDECRQTYMIDTRVEEEAHDYVIPPSLPPILSVSLSQLHKEKTALNTLIPMSRRAVPLGQDILDVACVWIFTICIRLHFGQGETTCPKFDPKLTFMFCPSPFSPLDPFHFLFAQGLGPY
ncbi:uncharacterized protein LOC111398273 [Olea europaea var. sylvestris]|uniref:uncharacterized protein LOC111398273 n=1 Tax=Olea europaea var. sylvestris TaxID=158386 RepID=UPI000C1CEFDC|nr:uncharacterized protein LOC111398273 [Olea europaea var. sylvestris]